MSEQMAPGVHFEESSRRIQISSTGSGLVGFMGRAARGRTDRPVRVNSWADYQKNFGGFSTEDDLAPKVSEFFAEGGVALSVARIIGMNAAGATNTTEFKDHSGTKTANLYAANQGTWGNNLSVRTDLYSKLISAQSATDRTLPTPVALPTNTQRLTVDSLSNIRVGDLLDVFNASSTLVSPGPVVVVGFDASNNDIFVYSPNGAITISANFTLRCASQHKVSTTLVNQVANGATFIDVQNAEGITRGSLLTISLFSQKAATGISYCQAVPVVVDRVVGNRVFLSIPVVLTGSMDPTKSAELRLANSGATIYITFTSSLVGADGNSVSIVLVPSAAANSVVVTGRTITVSNTNTLAAWTLTALEGQIDGSAEALSLITSPGSTRITGAGGTFLSALVAADQDGGPFIGGALGFVTSQEFKLEVFEGSASAETHEYLSMNPNSPNYVGVRLGGLTSPLGPAQTSESTRIILSGMDGVVDVTALAELNELPQATSSNIGLSSGSDGTALYDDDLIGAANPRSGMYLFDAEDGLDALAAPGYTGATFQRALAVYCENRGKLQAILDMPSDKLSADAMQTHREIVLGTDSSYAHLCAPRLRVLDQRTSVARGTTMWMPASAVFAGLLSQTLSRRGAHYSPGNLQPISALELEVSISEAEHGTLNETGICIFRDVARQGIRLYGDRTLLRGGDERKFGTVRRWLNFAKRAISSSMVSLAFEPANEKLFFKIYNKVDKFLEDQWRKGALYPSSNKSQAYAIKCDRETTSAADLRDGKVYCDIMVSPVTPAERIIFRLGVSAGGISVSESN